MYGELLTHKMNEDRVGCDKKFVFVFFPYYNLEYAINEWPEMMPIPIFFFEILCNDPKKHIFLRYFQ